MPVSSLRGKFNDEETSFVGCVLSLVSPLGSDKEWILETLSYPVALLKI